MRFCGKVEKDASTAFDGMFSLVNGLVNLEYAMKNTNQLLCNFSCELAKTIKIIHTISKEDES